MREHSVLFDKEVVSWSKDMLMKPGGRLDCHSQVIIISKFELNERYNIIVDDIFSASLSMALTHQGISYAKDPVLIKVTDCSSGLKDFLKNGFEVVLNGEGFDYLAYR